MIDAADANDASPDAAVFTDASLPDTCGNGFFEEFEVCDPAAGNVSPELRCDCNDDDPCTLDRCTSGTSAALCTCVCEHIPQYTLFGVGTCNDGNVCTNDIVVCGAGFPPNSMSCASTCQIASCRNEPITECVSTCGNGALDTFETCDDSSPNPDHACTCDDDDPCTMDIPTGGSAAGCSLTCVTPHPPFTGLGYTTCDDGRACTADVVIDGVPDPQTCRIDCANTLVDDWEVAYCAARDLPCVSFTPLASSVNDATCTTDCIDHINTVWTSTVCGDGLACTLDTLMSYDTTFPANPATCDVVCGTAIDGSWLSGRLSQCSANKPACLAFTADAFTYDATSPMNPSTCDADCHYTLDNAWLTDACDDDEACTIESPAFLESVAEITAAHACAVEVAYTCNRTDRRTNTELCNGTDDDCDQVVDDGCPSGMATAGPVTGTAFGGTGGDAYALSCPSGSVLVGFDGRSGERVDQLTPVCAPLVVVPADGAPERTYTVQTGTPTTIGSVGGTGGSVFMARCPANQVLTGMQGGSSSRLNRVGFTCSSLTLTRVARSWVVSIAGGGATGTFGSGGTAFTYGCPAGTIGTGAAGRAASEVDQLALVCSTPSIVGAPNVTYEIVARHSGSCLDVLGNVPDNGALIGQWQCADTANQRWQVQTSFDGGIRFVAQHSSKCIDVPSFSTTPGVQLIQYDCWLGAPQSFVATDLGNGYFTFSRAGLCLEVDGSALTNGAAVVQRACTGGQNQQWSLTPQ